MSKAVNRYILLGKVRTLLEWAVELLSKTWDWVMGDGVDTPETVRAPVVLKSVGLVILVLLRPMSNYDLWDYNSSGILRRMKTCKGKCKMERKGYFMINVFPYIPQIYIF